MQAPAPRPGSRRPPSWPVSLSCLCRCAAISATGDPAVGKTALLSVFTSGGLKFPKDYLMVSRHETSAALVFATPASRECLQHQNHSSASSAPVATPVLLHEQLWALQAAT